MAITPNKLSEEYSEFFASNPNLLGCDVDKIKEKLETLKKWYYNLSLVDQKIFKKRFMAGVMYLVFAIQELGGEMIWGHRYSFPILRTIILLDTPAARSVQKRLTLIVELFICFTLTIGYMRKYWRWLYDNTDGWKEILSLPGDYKFRKATLCRAIRKVWMGMCGT